MPDIPFRFPGDKRTSWLSIVGDYKPGDPPPTGYNDWHEWARVQHKAGLRQKRCGRCGEMKYPQELSAVVDEMKATTKKGGGKKVIVRLPVCLACHQKSESPRG